MIPSVRFIALGWGECHEAEQGKLNEQGGSLYYGPHHTRAAYSLAPAKAGERVGERGRGKNDVYPSPLPRCFRDSAPAVSTGVPEYGHSGHGRLVRDGATSLPTGECAAPVLRAEIFERWAVGYFLVKCCTIIPTITSLSSGTASMVTRSPLFRVARTGSVERITTYGRRVPPLSSVKDAMVCVWW